MTQRPSVQATLITAGSLENRWMHLSVISNANSVKINLYNHTSRQMIQALANNMSFT